MAPVKADETRDEHVFILAPTGRDSLMTARFLTEAGVPASACPSIEALCKEMENGCGALLLTGEALDLSSLQCLWEALATQPAWSDVPLIVLTIGGGARPANQDALQKLDEVGNVTLIERPVRGDTLLSAVRSGLRARRRQYDVRDHLAAEVLASETLRRSEERLRIALDAADLGAWQLDLVTQQMDCTPICKANFGVGAEDAFHYLDLLKAVHPEDLLATRREIERALREHDVYQQEYRVIWPDGSLHWIRTSGRANYDADGTPRDMAGVTLDITALKTAEHQREQLLARTQAARAEAEAASRLKDDFLATVSHELRTPLMAILGWSSLMRTGQVDAEMMPVALETIERNARSQSQLINDLLDVSRIISGKLRLDKQVTELRPIIAAAIEAARPTADEKNIQIEVRLEDTGGLLEGDPERLQQIVWNLLSNAIKFTQNGGLVSVQLRQTDSHFELTVADTGRGISPEFLAHVFDRFRQADQSSRRSQGGLGLGLSIVRQLVELHDGTVSASSDGEGKGASFSVQLPLMDAASLDASDEAAAAEEAPPRALGHLRVLVVDDEADTRLVLQSALERYGAEVATASSVPDALALLDTWRPNVLVSDIGLPDEDGYSLIQKVRERDAKNGGRIPAMALTAYVREEDSVRALQAGFQMHVAKPLQPDEFVTAVAELVVPPED